IYVLDLFSQNSFQKANFSADCSSDFWTITVDGYIQKWSLSGGAISGGDTILSGGGISLSFCGASDSPTFYTDNWSSGQIGINYYAPGSGWINIPTTHFVQDNGGHLNDQFYTIVGGVIQYVTYWDGTSLDVIDSLPAEFFVGVFDIGVDTLGHAWVLTGSLPGTTVDSLKVYDQGGKINSLSFQCDIYGYGSFFLNDTLYLGSNQDSIFPVIINGSTAQLGNGIPFPSSNFTDMASCQKTESTISIVEYPNKKIKVFPNPTNGYLMLPLDFEKSDITIYNMQGQLISPIINGKILDLSAQPSGLYFIKINSEDWQGVQKVLKL
ncbi:MAG: T9SS type A sorting domain-containing protein, partial [Bacteroidales bacterium]|nr:T9SS type A sorting domain-containing protein [Bacteroidales bacterium]